MIQIGASRELLSIPSPTADHQEWQVGDRLTLERRR